MRKKKVGWMLRGEKIYHEKTETRAKAGFHLLIEKYDGKKLLRYMKCICWHSLDIGSDASTKL